MPQAVSSLSSIAKPTGPVTRFLPDLSSKFGSSGESAASPKSALAFANFTRAGLRLVVRGSGFDVELGQRVRALERAPGSVERQVRVGEQLEAERGDASGVHLRGHLHLVLRRRVALREEDCRPPAADTAGRRWRCPRPSAGRPSIRVRRPSRPPPTGPSVLAQSGVVWRRLSSSSPICRRCSASFIRSLGRVDRPAAFVVVVQEGEQPVVVLLRDRIELVVVALGALDGQAEDALADGVHAIEHRLHAELLGIDAAFLVDHRVAQEAGRDDLVLRRRSAAGRRRSAR